MFCCEKVVIDFFASVFLSVSDVLSSIGLELGWVYWNRIFPANCQQDYLCLTGTRSDSVNQVRWCWLGDKEMLPDYNQLIMTLKYFTIGLRSRSFGGRGRGPIDIIITNKLCSNNYHNKCHLWGVWLSYCQSLWPVVTAQTANHMLMPSWYLMRLSQPVSGLLLA